LEKSAEHPAREKWSGVPSFWKLIFHYIQPEDREGGKGVTWRKVGKLFPLSPVSVATLSPLPQITAHNHRDTNLKEGQGTLLPVYIVRTNQEEGQGPLLPLYNLRERAGYLTSCVLT
jgi:hypothetical protein